MKPVIHVYVVLEHATKDADAKLLGVFTKRVIAERVAISRSHKGEHGYISILKKTVKGPNATLEYIKKLLNFTK